MSHRKIFESFLSLTVVQAANFIVPLFALPWLTRALGPSAWGEVSFIIFVMQFLLVLTDYGFSLSAVRSIAQVQDDPNTISTIFSACWTIQWLLFLLITVAAFVACEIFGISLSNLVGLALVLGSVLFPLWLFQGLEHLKASAIVQLLSRLFMLFLILMVVDGPEDIVLALLLLTGHNLIAGPILLVWAFRSGVIRYTLPSVQSLKSRAAEGWGIFISKISVSSYTSLIPIVLGHVVGSEGVGYYYLADKIRVAASYVLTPISQSLFPRTSYLFARDRMAGLSLISRYGLALFLLSTVSGVLLFVAAPLLVGLAGGPSFANSVLLLQIMAITPLLVSVSNVIGVQILLPLNKTKQFNFSIHFGAIVAIVGIGPMVLAFDSVGAAAVSVIAEAVVAGSMLVYFLANYQALIHGDVQNAHAR